VRPTLRVISGGGRRLTRQEQLEATEALVRVLQEHGYDITVDEFERMYEALEAMTGPDDRTHQNKARTFLANSTEKAGKP
jgi:hypothetical protein